MPAAIEELVNRYKRIIVDDHPVAATFLGFHERDGDLGDLSAEAEEDKNRHLKELLTELERVSLDGASVDARIDFEAFRASLRLSIFEHEELRSHERRPSDYIGTALSGCHELVVGDFAPIEDRARSLVSRLEQVPAVLASMEENVKRPPTVFAGVGVEMATGGVGFIAAVVPGVREAVPSLADDLERSSAAAATAFKRAARYLGGLGEGEDVPFHVGRERYEWLLRENHMLDMDSEELREAGRRVLGETRAKMDELAREIDPSAGWHEIMEVLKTDHPDSRGLRAYYASEMARARDFVREQDLVTIPEAEELEVIDTPLFLRKLLPYAAYHPAGPFEKKQRGLFYVTPVDETSSEGDQEQQLRGHSVHTIPIVALHEAYPGHHLQLIRGNRVKHEVRKLTWNNVFIEGWALYCEEMMKDAGFYPDPRTRLCQLKETLWRAARVIVDVGLQLGEMTIEDAIDFMISEAALERVNATAEVKRYTANPTQPSSYLIGKLSLLDLRRRYEERAGASFDLKTFHDTLLDIGSVQPKLVELSLGLN